MYLHACFSAKEEWPPSTVAVVVVSVVTFVTGAVVIDVLIVALAVVGVVTFAGTCTLCCFFVAASKGLYKLVEII